MITDQDVEKLKQTFATKDELKSLSDNVEAFELRVAKSFTSVENMLGGLENRIDGLENRMDSLDGKMERLETKVDGLETKIENLETNLLNSMDHVLGEIHKLHDENIITSSYKRTLVDHEARITKIEHLQSAN